mmetsp:Transcript_27664/g.60920  ORF Transcript_27664/g.60920 Transcript_27664/m.60920 type:complete len:638 (+) Transcript_27664:272-2185(+)|eukprot:CAMPEP_0168305094 /NCGR_PEP_ID=MMETSP0142_2-20121227/49174_1 /TAXON_ID=44445 /ORGANISM="Pseudo-nitzschia australis, Strain 10249 10 AB" /LENGTH=637 /DNA_ID=CAMNT_0008256505 /DNA_START=240 /DNA_END=2153 /DNA_ORIENTATION=+
MLPLHIFPLGHQIVLAVFLVLMATNKSTEATSFVRTEQSGAQSWGYSLRRLWHQKPERDQERRINREDNIDSDCPIELRRYRKNALDISRGGGTNLEKEVASIDKSAAIVTIGVIDLSRKGRANHDRHPNLYSSIILVVDDKGSNKNGITVDETLLQNYLPPVLLRDNNENSNITSNETSTIENVQGANNAIVESLALLCDVLVMRIDDNEETLFSSQLMKSVTCGDKRRRSAGMAGGRLWIQTTKESSKIELRRRVIDNKEETTDDCYHSTSTTTWSTLFSNNGGTDADSTVTHNARRLQELYATVSQEVIESYRHSTPESKQTEENTEYSPSQYALATLFPSVSVQYLSKKKSPQISAEKNVAKDQNTTKRIEKDDNQIIGDVIATARCRLENLETKMEEVVLRQSSNPMPLLEFGSLVQDILETAETKLQKETKISDSFRRGLMKGIVNEVQRLYKDQLQALRNYYGHRYEAILDEKVDPKDDNDEAIERRWAIGAEHMTQAFLAAAQNNVPAMYRVNPKDGIVGIKTNSTVSFDHIDELQGLVRDMIESTERRKDEQNVANLLESEDDDEAKTESASASARKFRLPKLPKRLERLAARAFVFGVNYIQGWLAWQGIKKAALERDRNQPKFPLF